MNGSLTEPQSGGRGGTSDIGGTEHLIELLRTLADPIRLRMVRLLESQAQHGLSVGELGEILKLPQSTVSRHLKTLSDARLTDPRRDGTSVFYRLSDSAGRNASRQLRQLAKSHLDHDPVAKSDSHRLAATLRKRDAVTQNFFGKNAPQWDQLRAQWFGDTFHLEGLLALLNPLWTVADIGTGTGIMLPVLAPHVKSVIAVDPSAAMLRGAKMRAKDAGLENIDFCQGAAESLPIEPETVDVAILALVLCYTLDPEAAIREVARVLKPGGVLLVIDLQPHRVELFRETLSHRWMGFAEKQLQDWTVAAGFSHARWHAISPKQARAKETATSVPDLFVFRAERP